VANGGNGLAVFGAFACGGGTGPAGFTDACLKANYPDLALINPGTTKLSRRDVLTGPDDQLRNRQYTGYFDVIFDDSPDFQLKNQLFFDNTRNVNNNAYGFSQFVKSWVLEDKIVADKTFHTDVGKFEIQLSPSVRYTKFHYGDDFDVEEFHRVDLSVGYTPASDRLLSNESGTDYADYLRGHYTDLGAAALVDLDFNFGLDVIGGLRYDHVDVTSSYDPSRMDHTPSVINGSDSQGGWSWNGSVSYKLPFGLHPYGTIARQTTIVVGQGAEIAPDALISTGGSGFLAASKLYEGGIKGSWLNEKLYAAVSVYQQTRTDHNVQSSTVNQSVETDGMEAELRWSVDRHLLLSGAYTRTKVYNLTFQDAGSAFSFFGIEDLVNVKDGSLFQGGQVEGLIPITSKEGSRRAGIPENLESATATYAFDNGLAFSGSVTHVQSVYSGQSMVVKLPAYTLVDLGVSYTKGPFLFRVVVKNATDATYYRANFTELFGSTIVLPEKPRSFQATASFKF
jgi:iron complex outermembrane receptor protein